MSRDSPVLDDDPRDLVDASSGPGRRRPSRRASLQQRDRVAVGVLTPALLVGIALGLLILGQTFYPDPYVEPTVAPTPSVRTRGLPPTPAVVVEPIDTARLNAGVLDKAPPFEWPEVDGLKFQADPGRPSEHADYTPNVSEVDIRRLILASTVNLTSHSSPQFVQPAVDELAKQYALRPTKPKVIDIAARAGWVPDESTFGVVLGYGAYRVQIETVVTNPPVKPTQRAEVETFTLHLADHILRRLQETITGGKRTAPEWTAVHWRDHLVRMLPFGG